MARTGQVVENPRRREWVRFDRTSADTGGACLEMHVEAEPGALSSPIHTHPNADEEMEVLAGTARFHLNGSTRDARAGEQVTVPRGTPHTFSNPFDQPLVLKGRLTPALRFETMLETIYGLTRTGRVNRNGIPNPLQAAVIFTEFRREWSPVFLPWPVRKILMPLLAIPGRLFYRAWYPEFSPDGPARV